MRYECMLNLTRPMRCRHHPRTTSISMYARTVRGTVDVETQAEQLRALSARKLKDDSGTTHPT